MRVRVAALVLSTVAVLCACSTPTQTAGSDEPTPPPQGGAGAEGGGSGYEEVFAAVDGLAGQERIDELAALAEQEGGELALYTSLTSDLATLVAETFEEQYGISVALYRASSATVLQRVGEEADANFSGADVLETNGTEMTQANASDILVSYETAAQDDLVENSVFEGWTATRFNNFVVSWNTGNVAEGEQPSSWEDLADPAWDDRLALEAGDYDWYKTLWEHWVNDQGMSPDEADGLFEQMADSALIVSGHTAGGELLTAGEFDVYASNYSYIVQRAVDDGAPVAWQPSVEPIIQRPNGVGLVANPPHPAAAALFMEWLLSEGQQLLADEGLDPSRSDLATTGDADVISVDLEDLLENTGEWTDRYDAVIGLGEPSG